MPLKSPFTLRKYNMALFRFYNQLIIASAIFGGIASASAAEVGKLSFCPDNFNEASLTMPTGETVKYKAYENIFYVTNIEDSVYQTLNLYVPENLKSGDSTPLFLRTYIGGYMASSAKTPSPSDATGRALKEGYVVCIPGSRGANSTVSSNGKKIGRAHV